MYQKFICEKVVRAGIARSNAIFPSRRATKRPATAGAFMVFPLPACEQKRESPRLGESVEPVVFAIVRDFFTEAGGSTE